MKRFIVLVLVVLCAFSINAMAVIIGGDNMSFEDPIVSENNEVSCGPGNTLASPPGWGWGTGSFVAIRNPGTGNTDWGAPTYVTDGDNGLKTLGRFGQYFNIYQNLSNSTGYYIEADTDYLLSVDVYVPYEDYGENAWFDVFYQLLDGNYEEVRFGQQGSPDALHDYMTANGYDYNEWFTITLPYQNVDQHTGAGLQITLTSAGVWVDNVRVEAIPEPATISIIGIGMLGLLRKRKQ